MGLSESVNRRRTDNTMVKRKRTNNDLRNITHKTKDRVTRTPLKTRDDLRFSGKVSSSCSTSGANRSGRFICTINVLMVHQKRKL